MGNITEIKSSKISEIRIIKSQRTNYSFVKGHLEFFRCPKFKKLCKFFDVNGSLYKEELKDGFHYKGVVKRLLALGIDSTLQLKDIGYKYYHNLEDGYVYTPNKVAVTLINSNVYYFYFDKLSDCEVFKDLVKKRIEEDSFLIHKNWQ